MDTVKRLPRKRSYKSHSISSATANALTKNVINSTVNAFSLLQPLFNVGRVYNIDIQLGDTAQKTYEKFCTEIGKLGGNLRNSLENAVELTEYNGSKNEEFESIEKLITDSTVTLALKKKKTSSISYELYGAYAKLYEKSEIYTTDDMIYTSKLFKKKLNLKPSMKLGECYKIVSEIKRSNNEFSNYLDITEKDLFEAKSAFIDYNIVANGGSCYRVIADKYLLVCFKLNVNVPYWFSDEMDDRYKNLDYNEYEDDDIVYSRFPDGTTLRKRLLPNGSSVELEALRRYYRKMLRERFYKYSKNNMFEARAENFNNLSEEASLIDSIFSNTKLIIDSLLAGQITLSDIDLKLKDISESTASLNILIDVAKEFYGNVDSFTIDKDYYLNKYEKALTNVVKTSYTKFKLPKMSIDFNLFSEVSLIKFSSQGLFDEPLTQRDVKFIVNNAGNASDMDRLSVDYGRSKGQRSSARYENGNAVFTVLSKTYDRNAYDTERAKMIQVPGKVSAVCKLIISTDGFEITSTSGTER